MQPTDRAPAMRRRRFLQTALSAPAAGAAAGLLAAAPASAEPQAGGFARLPDRATAVRRTADWLRSTESRNGFWLPEPDRPEIRQTVSAPNGFYTGSAGMALFFADLAKATGERGYWNDAKRAGDYLMRSWQDTAKVDAAGTQFSLYTGLAGTLHALAVLARETGDRAYRTELAAGLEFLLAGAKPQGGGVGWTVWPGMTGNGGIVVALLAIAEQLDDATLRRRLQQAARAAGTRIVEQAAKDPRGGLRWQGMPPALAQQPEGSYFPNHQLGTAGVAFALARLATVTGEKRFLNAALGGAEHLRTIATVEQDAALIHFREPDLQDIFYLGYCNGPAGTARLYYQLYLATRDPAHLAWAEMLARGVMASGVPEHQTPGLWNVTCQCCGSAGIVDFFLGMWAATGKAEYRAFAIRVADQMLSRRTDHDGKGFRWYQAYTRVKPAEVTAETGYMVGAAGIAAALLHVELAETGRYQGILVPADHPFPTSRAA